MLGQIYRSGLVRNRLVVEDEFILFGKRVGDFHLQVAGIAFFTVFACICEDESFSLFVLEGLSRPDRFVKSF